MNRSRTLRSLVLIAAVYLAARWAGWTGPNADVVFDNSLLYPGVALITALGLWRIARRSSCD